MVSKVILDCAWCRKSRDPADLNHWLPAGDKAEDAETTQTYRTCHQGQVNRAEAGRAFQRSR